MNRGRVATKAVASAAAVATLLVGCGGPSAQVRALKDDPLGRYEPPGGRLIRSTEQSEGTSLLGKPVQAEYTRLFALPAGDPKQQLRRALDAATAANWDTRKDLPLPERLHLNR